MAEFRKPRILYHGHFVDEAPDLDYKPAFTLKEMMRIGLDPKEYRGLHCNDDTCEVCRGR